MIFNRNSSRLGQFNAGNIVPDESYYGESGALRITLEALQNDQAIFEALMAQDFEEMYSMQEGALNESQIEALQEGAIGDFVNKIKEIVRKIAEKIKGLFHSFMVKVNAVIIRDNKKFVEKYRRDVLSKDLSKMKYKWSNPTGSEMKMTDAVSEIERCITDVKGATSPDALGKIEDKISEGEFADAFLKRMLGGSGSTDEESFNKDAHELYYEDESEEDGLKSDRLTQIMGRLVNSKDALKDIEKTQKDADKAFTKYLSMIDKHVNGMAKSIPGNKDNSNEYGEDGANGTKKMNIAPNDQAGHRRSMSYNSGDNDSKQIVMKQLVMIQKTVTKTQGLFAKAAGSVITETKFGLAQDRRVFAKAASHNPKSVKESALFESYAEEAAEYDIMSSFEAPGMN